MIKVWLKNVETCVGNYGEWATTFNLSAYSEQNKGAGEVKEELWQAVKLCKPMFLVNEDELGASREVDSLKERLEAVKAERDAAMVRVQTLKDVVKAITEKL